MDFQKFVGRREQSRRPWLFPPTVAKAKKKKGKGPGYHKPHRGRPGEVGGSLPRKGGAAKVGGKISSATVPLWDKKITLAKMGMVPVDELPPPKKGHLRLYHTTGKTADLPNIEARGLLAAKATGLEAPADIVWATNLPTAYSESRGLVVMDVPKRSAEKVNVTDYMIRGGVLPKNIIATYPMITYDKRGQAAAKRWDLLIDTKRKFGLERVLSVTTDEMGKLFRQVPDA